MPLCAERAERPRGGGWTADLVGNPAHGTRGRTELRTARLIDPSSGDQRLRSQRLITSNIPGAKRDRFGISAFPPLIASRNA